MSQSAGAGAGAGAGSGAETEPGRRRAAPVPVVVALVVVVVVVAAAAVALAARSGSSGSSGQTCDRTAAAPGAGTVDSVSQGAQLVVGDVRLGIGGVSDDGCAVDVRGDVGRVEVGERVEVAGVPVMLLAVERRDGQDDEAGGAFEATFWVGAAG
ncbi:hypothetical protein KIN34_08445 [Cellulomonas sp. DKR-3]|uniref:Uncharacterized protein n=1 Tax=Cellulomonas fulva TaxID=2835530 RepID=A0ABS5TYV5_9CELL|nr:hypothetical protein [Cellulomonas fulva]MBT0994312.1 hypothetical protein [Cellulomonas fulva]